MGYETKPGFTTNVAQGGQYDQVGDTNLQYTNMAAQYAADAAQSAIDAANAGRLTIGTVTTGAPGSAADAVITGDVGEQVLNLTIPTGEQGPVGPSGGGTGTVTSVSVVSANGLAGTVANPTTTPAITLTSSVTGIVKGNGTGLTAAVAGTDYLTPVMSAIGDMVAGGAAGVQTRVPGNTTTTLKVLTQTGNGTVSAQPTWTTPSSLIDLSGLVPYTGATANINLGAHTLEAAGVTIGGATPLLPATIGVTVQGYDANTVKKNVANVFTATQTPDNGTAAVSTTSTYTFDGADQIREVTLTNAITVTMGAPTGIVQYAMYKFLLKAGDTSARTFAWNTAFKFPAATAPLTSGTVTSGAYDIISFIGGASNTLIYDGHIADVR